MPREDYDAFPKTDANYVPLSPLSFIRRAAEVYGEHPAIIHGTRRQNWRETYDRCVQMGHALWKLGVRRNDTISFLCPNTPEMIEAHFGVNMSGAVLNSINTRLDADTVAYILEHSDSKLVFADTQFSPVLKEALAILWDKAPGVIDIVDGQADLNPGEGERSGDYTYEQFLTTGDAHCD